MRVVQRRSNPLFRVHQQTRTLPLKKTAPVKQVPAHSKYFPKFGAFPFAWNPARLAGAAALTLLLISVILFWLTSGTKPRVEEASIPAQSQEEVPSPTQATDESRACSSSLYQIQKTLRKEQIHRSRSTRTSSNGGRNGSARQEFEASLIAENLAMPSAIKVFDRSSIMLRGDDSKSESFSVTSPFRTVISSDRPTFRWTALSGASSYVVSVYDAKLNLINTSGPIVETQWLMPSHLERGVIYTWVVTALKDGNEVLAPTLPARAEFKIIDRSEWASIGGKIKSLHSGVARGVIYAKAGLLDEAEQELKTYIARHPEDGSAKKVLQTIKSWREP